MKKLVGQILNKNLDSAKSTIAEMFHSIMEKKLLEMKKMVSAKMYSEMRLDGITPSTNIEDRRGERAVNSGLKTNLGGDQTVNRSGKGNMPSNNTTVINKNNIKEDTEEQLDEARIKIMTRVRGGKIQRRKKISNVPGMTIRGGKLTRMSPAERRRRKMGARKAKIKRKSKKTQMLMKRKRSLMRRRAMGL